MVVTNNDIPILRTNWHSDVGDRSKREISQTYRMLCRSQTFTDGAVADRIRGQWFRRLYIPLLITQIVDLVFLGLAVCFLADPFVKFVGLGWRSFRANGWNIFDVVVILGSIATTLAILMGVGGFAARQAQKLFLVCVAFKLMQKLDSLNQLFKTAV